MSIESRTVCASCIIATLCTVIVDGTAFDSTYRLCHAIATVIVYQLLTLFIHAFGDGEVAAGTTALTALGGDERDGRWDPEFVHFGFR
jgi:hypothetical protein